MAPRKKQSRIRAALAARKPRTSHFDIVTASYDELREAHQALADARQMLVIARHGLKPKADLPDDQRAAAERRHAEQLRIAEAAMAEATEQADACRERIIFKKLDPRTYEVIRQETPLPTEEEQKADGWRWDRVYAIAEKAAYDEDGTPAGLTADEWREQTAAWEAEDWYEFQSAVLDSQRGTASSQLPKA